ncbi:hypothetical protein H2200_001728 [Cladophialophora chaetospira]|uniref:GPI anchored serine-threonine rich protein n=1 Tax=Cladophialophora chaetospira TaxID=386627 RepID=A0AA39CPX6_9EURO|nr:hypothetical protein H2200_001728 [Cladophialophora chaetospira]
MMLASYVFILGSTFLLATATNHSLPNALTSRQSVACYPLFLEYPSPDDVPCGDNTYVMSTCVCCPGGTVGCYPETQTCSTDGVTEFCCEDDGSDCGGQSGGGEGDSGTATTTPATPAAPTPTPDDSNSSAATSSSDTDPASSPTSPPSQVQSGTANVHENSPVGLVVMLALLVFKESWA